MSEYTHPGDVPTPATVETDLGPTLVALQPAQFSRTVRALTDLRDSWSNEESKQVHRLAEEELPQSDMDLAIHIRQIAAKAVAELDALLRHYFAAPHTDLAEIEAESERRRVAIDHLLRWQGESLKRLSDEQIEEIDKALKRGRYA